MKSRLLIAIPIAAAILIGCGTGDKPDVTSLKGTWTGTGVGYEGKVLDRTQIELVITEVRADEDVFLGYKKVNGDLENPSVPGESIRGLVGSDGTISITDEDGLSFFTMSGDTLKGSYLESGKENGTAKVITLTRK